MTRNNVRGQHYFTNTDAFRNVLYSFIYYWMSNWRCFSKCRNLYCFSLYILRGRTLSLLFIYVSGFCNFCRVLSLIQFNIWRIDIQRSFRSNSFLTNLYWIKRHILPDALFRLSWNATNNFRLPRCFCRLKLCFICWFVYDGYRKFSFYRNNYRRFVQ
jgi:hypothetical protein